MPRPLTWFEGGRSVRNLRPRRSALCLLVIAAAAFPATASAANSRQEIQNALSRVVTQTKQLPGNSAQEKALHKVAKEAYRQRARPCTAFGLMKRYRSLLARLRRAHPPGGRAQENSKRQRAVATRGMLEAAAIAADASLLSAPNTRSCGGAKTAPTDGDLPKVTLLDSNERGLTMRVSLPQARFAFRRFGNRDFAELLMDGLRPNEGVGAPGIPSMVEQFGIPTGAAVNARVFNSSSYLLRGVTLLPQQEEPVDQRDPNADRPPEETFYDKPFAINNVLYRSRTPFPASLGGVDEVGAMRDIRAGGAKVVGGQYRARQKELRVITSVDVRIDFGGENRGTFGDARLLDPFNATFQRLYDSIFINWDVIKTRPGVEFPPIDFCGEEVLIVTSNALRPAALTLKAQKDAEGFLTRVVETGAGPGQIGTTHTQIQTFIRGELNSDCWVRPSYVILIGDTSHVATWIVGCGPGSDPAASNCHGGTGVASDHPYAMKDDADFLADTAVGRIPANTLDQANTVVNKIVTYETTAPAPTGDDFYRHFTNTAFFEPTYICELNEGASGTPNCDSESPEFNAHWVFHPEITQDVRGFTITAERIRDAMIARGYTVDRLYYAFPANDPQTYHDGSPMPAAIKKPGFPWDADTSDFLNVFNEGRNIVFHRDHGWPHGFAHPDLSTGNVPAMTNGTELPVVFGINCSSARYDVPGDPSMVESLLLHPTGGAVGGFGDTRVSGTWPNNSISFGFFDALFPNVNAGYGADDPLERMGDVLVAGKNYMATHDAGNLYGHSMLYGYFGDPTMQLWIAAPVVFDPAKIRATIFREDFPFPKPPGPGPDPPPYYVLAEVSQPEAEGSLVTLIQKGGQGGEETIGRGVVLGGRAVIYPLVRNQRTTSNMEIRLQNQGMLAGVEQVEGK